MPIQPTKQASGGLDFNSILNLGLRLQQQKRQEEQFAQSQALQQQQLQLQAQKFQLEMAKFAKEAQELAGLNDARRGFKNLIEQNLQVYGVQSGAFPDGKSVSEAMSPFLNSVEASLAGFTDANEMRQFAEKVMVEQKQVVKDFMGDNEYVIVHPTLGIQKVKLEDQPGGKALQGTEQEVEARVRYKYENNMPLTEAEKHQLNLMAIKDQGGIDKFTLREQQGPITREQRYTNLPNVPFPETYRQFTEGKRQQQDYDGLLPPPLLERPDGEMEQPFPEAVPPATWGFGYPQTMRFEGAKNPGVAHDDGMGIPSIGGINLSVPFSDSEKEFIAAATQLPADTDFNQYYREGNAMDDLVYEEIMKQRYQKAEDQLFTKYPDAVRLSPARQWVLTDMVFQKGIGTLSDSKYDDFWSALKREDYDSAAMEMLDDPTYGKHKLPGVRARAQYNAALMRRGKPGSGKIDPEEVPDRQISLVPGQVTMTAQTTQEDPFLTRGAKQIMQTESIELSSGIEMSGTLLAEFYGDPNAQDEVTSIFGFIPKAFASMTSFFSWLVDGNFNPADYPEDGMFSNYIRLAPEVGAMWKGSELQFQSGIRVPITGAQAGMAEIQMLRQMAANGDVTRFEYAVASFAIMENMMRRRKMLDIGLQMDSLPPVSFLADTGVGNKIKDIYADVYPNRPALNFEQYQTEADVMFKAYNYGTAADSSDREIKTFNGKTGPVEYKGNFRVVPTTRNKNLNGGQVLPF